MARTRVSKSESFLLLTLTVMVHIGLYVADAHCYKVSQNNGADTSIKMLRKNES